MQVSRSLAGLRSALRAAWEQSCGRGNPSRQAVAFILLCSVLLGAKIHKAFVLGEGRVGRSAMFVLGADLAFLAAYGALWLLLLRKSKGPVLRVLYYALTSLLAVVGIVEHGFFTSTGALLDGPILLYGLKHSAELKKVLMSEARATLVLCAILALCFVVLPAGAARLAAMTAPWLASRRRAVWRWTAAAASVAIAGGGAASALGRDRVADPLRPLTENALVRLGRGLVSSHREGRRRVAAQALAPAARIARVSEKEPPNVVLVILEAARASSFNPYMDEYETTPFFRELAQRGVLVRNAYAVVPHTTKALVSIECGVFPRLDPEPTEADPDEIPSPCLAELLGRRGYATAFFQPADGNFERRRDLVRRFGYGSFFDLKSVESRGFEQVNYFGCEDRAMLPAIWDWVDQQKGPFLLSALTLSSHHPYLLPSTFERRVYTSEKHLNDYLNTLRYADTFLHELYDGLAARGRLEDTLLVVVGDHGEAFAEHGVRQHDPVLYEEGLHVPLLLAGAGVESRGAEIAGLRQHVDLLPTILEAAGYRIEGGSLPGKSILTTEGHERLFFSCYYRDYCLGMREAASKLIHHPGGRGPELYDLSTDPGERTNLAKDASFAAWVQTATGRTLDWQAQVDAIYEAASRRRRETFVSSVRPTIAHGLEVQLSPGVHLLGYDIDKAEARPGEEVTITHYFQCIESAPKAQTLLMRLDGPKRFHHNHVPVAGDYPFERWQKGEYVTDRLTLRLRSGTPAGTYVVKLGVTERRQNDDDDAPPVAHRHARRRDRLWDTARLAVFAPVVDVSKFVAPSRPADAPDGAIRFGDDIELLGCTINGSELNPGLHATIKCFFHVLSAPPPRWTVTMHVKGQHLERDETHVPVGGQLPLSQWLPGQYVVDAHELWVGGLDPFGDYQVLVGIREGEGDAGAPVAPQGAAADKLGRVAVAAYKVIASAPSH